MRKIYVGLALALAGVACLGGCQKETEVQPVMESAKTDGDKELVVWAWDDTFNVKAAQLAAEEIKKTSPDIQVRVVSKDQDEIYESLSNGLASGLKDELPDIVLVEDYKIQKLLLQYEDAFEELTESFDFERFLDYKVEVSSKDGCHYGIPFDSGTAVMFYREDIMEQAGYTQEDMQDLSWEEYIKIGGQVKEKTGKYMLSVQPDDLGLIRIMQQSAGAWYVKADGITVNLTDNAALKDAIHIYQQLLQTGVAKSITGWDGFVDAFQQEQVATVVSGCWSISNIKGAADQSGKWRVAAIPRMGKNADSVNASNIGGCSWYILKNKPNVEAAITFMQNTFADNEAFMNQLIREINIVSCYKNSSELEAYQEEDAFFGNQKTQVFFARTAEQIPSVNYGTRTYEIEKILTEALQNMLKGEAEDAALKKAQIKAQAVVGG